LNEIVKQALKAIVPTAALPLLRHVRNTVQLGASATRQFDAAALGGISADSARLFRDPAMDAEWQESLSRLNALFGDVERLGGVNPGDRRALYYLVRKLRPTRVLEVGTHVGASTLYIASALQKNSAADAKITTVDVVDVNAGDAFWREAGLSGSPAALAGRAGCAELINFVKQDALTFMAETRDKFDLVFLDGDHAARAVYLEVAAALRALRPGGLILLHDYYPGGKPLFAGGDFIGGPYVAVRRLCQENPAIAVLPLGELPWPTKMGSRMTSLALLHRSGKPVQ
jgi:predicted O-methyltransferase YrrM